MRVFLLEDDPYRIIWFKRQFIGHVLDITDSIDEAKELLKLHIYDWIFLDHDLKENHYSEIYNPEDKTTGYEIALFLEEFSNIQPSARIIVHTLSPSGGDRIMQALRNRNLTERVGYHILRTQMKVDSTF